MSDCALTQPSNARNSSGNPLDTRLDPLEWNRDYSDRNSRTFSNSHEEMPTICTAVSPFRGIQELLVIPIA